MEHDSSSERRFGIPIIGTLITGAALTFGGAQASTFPKEEKYERPVQSAPSVPPPMAEQAIQNALVTVSLPRGPDEHVREYRERVRSNTLSLLRELEDLYWDQLVYLRVELGGVDPETPKQYKDILALQKKVRASQSIEEILEIEWESAVRKPYVEQTTEKRRVQAEETIAKQRLRDRTLFVMMPSGYPAMEGHAPKESKEVNEVKELKE